MIAAKSDGVVFPVAAGLSATLPASVGEDRKRKRVSSLLAVIVQLAIAARPVHPAAAVNRTKAHRLWRSSKRGVEGCTFPLALVMLFAKAFRLVCALAIGYAAGGRFPFRRRDGIAGAIPLSVMLLAVVFRDRRPCAIGYAAGLRSCLHKVDLVMLFAKAFRLVDALAIGYAAKPCFHYSSPRFRSISEGRLRCRSTCPALRPAPQKRSSKRTVIVPLGARLCRQARNAGRSGHVSGCGCGCSTLQSSWRPAGSSGRPTV